MKKVEFSFLCKQDPLKMPAQDQTRHCDKCARNIVDFTGMRPDEIARHLKTALKPCGFMFPWQLDEVNDHLQEQRIPFIGNGLKKLAKIAAVVTTPLVATQAHAQDVTKTYGTEQTIPQTSATGTEIMLLSSTGTALAGISLDLVNASGKTIAKLKTDTAGKIYIASHLTQEGGTFTVMNMALGLRKTFTLGSSPVCLSWKTEMGEQVQPNVFERKEQFCAFEFVLIKGDKSEKMKTTKVAITLYDSTNQQVRELITGRTDRKGQLKLGDKNLEGVHYLLFSLETADGIKTSYINLKDIDLQKTNLLNIYDFDGMMVGIMVE